MLTHLFQSALLVAEVYKSNKKVTFLVFWSTSSKMTVTGATAAVSDDDDDDHDSFLLLLLNIQILILQAGKKKETRTRLKNQRLYTCLQFILVLPHSTLHLQPIYATVFLHKKHYHFFF